MEDAAKYSLVCRAGGFDQAELTYWRLEGTGARLAGRRGIEDLWHLDVHPAGTTTAFATDARVGFWDLKDGSEGQGFAAASLGGFGFAPDGRLWGTAKGEVFCWEFPGRQAAKTWKTSQVVPLPPQPGLSALVPGRRGVLAAGQFGAAWLLRLEQGEVRHVGAGWRFPTRAALGAAAWNADETLAVFGNDAGEVYVVRPGVAATPLRLAAHRDSVTGVAFDRAGVLATGGRDGLVRLWRPEGEAYRAELSLRLPGPVTALAFTAEEGGLAVLVDGEFAVRLWRLDRLREKLVGLNLEP